MIGRGVLISLALFYLGFTLPAVVSAQMAKITTSYVSDSAGVLPLWLAKEAGIFARNGLDVQAVRVHAAVPDNRISRKQYPYMPGLQVALDLVAEDNPKARNARPEEFIDNRFIKELDESGFIDGLYKGKGR
jgi:hypothetical protein